MIVISGINLFEGGPLSIYYDCLKAITDMGLHRKYHVAALVHKAELFREYSDKLNVIEFPRSRKNYLCRLYYEYIYFNRISKREHVDLWVSLHDITPRVKADAIYTYCHNPSPFMKVNIKNIKYSWRNFLFSVFYKYLYRINIKSATGIIVQQDWMRHEFLKMYPIKNVIVAHPKIDSSLKINDDSANNRNCIFLYPAYPRFFKNFEVICEACKYIRDEKFEVWITVGGTENRYAKDLYRKYKGIPNIKWLGIVPRDEVFRMYGKANCLIFPSKLETWGLPISEFKETGKDIIMADLPYAYEALGSYDKCMFFDEDDSRGLAILMNSVICKEQKYQPKIEMQIKQPYAQDWNDLLIMMTKGLQNDI